MPEYKSLSGAEEAWIVHFTCQDDFRPVWQSDTELDDGVNVVHFSHDINFRRVQMHARFKDTAGKVKEIDEFLAIIYSRRLPVKVGVTRNGLPYVSIKHAQRRAQYHPQLSTFLQIGN